MSGTDQRFYGRDLTAAMIDIHVKETKRREYCRCSSAEAS